MLQCLAPSHRFGKAPQMIVSLCSQMVIPTFQECSLQLIELYCVRQFHVLLEQVCYILLFEEIFERPLSATATLGHLSAHIIPGLGKI